MAFMRMYGMEGDPGPKPAPRRKSAASGPRAKAARKRTVRAKRAQRGGQGAPKGPGKKGRSAGQILSGNFGKAAGRTAELAQQLLGRDFKGAAGNLFGSVRPGGAGGGGRRSMNVANVKALRRSIRRLEGFKKLVKRVDKMLPSGARMHHSAPRSHAHKRGCKCAVCK